MRAIQVMRFGGPEVLVATQLTDPQAGPGEAVIEVSVADVLFVETQIRHGWGGEVFGIKPPYVPGFGVAGTVRSVGAGVGPSWVGRRVVAHTEGGGGYAEQVAVRADRMLPIPDGLGDREATSLLHDGATALAVFDAARVTAQKSVLVVAAAGGMGLLLVELAHAVGARVIGAARGQKKLDAVALVGADDVVDYSAIDWTARVRRMVRSKGVDIVFDGAGGEIGDAAFGLVARGGFFSAHGAPSGGFASIDERVAKASRIELRGIEHVRMPNDVLKRFTARALAEASAKRLHPVIGQTFPLFEAAAAHAAIGAREVVGKTLLVA